MNIADVLQKARDLIATPDNWTQGEYARDGHGHATRPRNSRAVCWCSSGAIMKVMDVDYSPDDALAVLHQAGGFQWDMNIPKWNDSMNRKHSEVLALFDAAIAAESSAIETTT